MNISRKISVIVTACVLVVSSIVLIIHYQYSKRQLLDQTLMDIQSSMLHERIHYKEYMGLVEANLQALSHLINNELLDPVLDKGVRFNKEIIRFSDGAWRNDKNDFNGEKHAGLFVPDNIEITKENKYFYETVLAVFDSFAPATISHPLFDNIWMAGNHQSKLIFDPLDPNFIYRIKSEHDETSALLTTLELEEGKPKKELKWTPALFDIDSDTWKMSAVFPLYVDNKWQETLGLTINIGQVFELIRFENEHFENEYNVVIDESANYILSGLGPIQLKRSEKGAKLNEKDKQELKVAFTQTLTGVVSVLKPIKWRGIEYQVIANKIYPMNWVKFRLIPTKHILAPLLDTIRDTFLLIFVMAILLGGLINIAVRKWVVNPLLQITEYARNYALGNKPQQTVIQRDDEIGELNNAFQSMHNALTREAQQLLQSEHRYRQVIININETIIQIDTAGNWYFLSPLWTRLSGHDVQRSLHHPVIDFLHPVDREKVAHIVTLLLEDKQPVWSGEVRLKHQDKHYLWVNLSLQRSKDLSAAISGTIENVHINHLTRELNQIIRTSEQMVLVSSCSVFTVLEFLTESLQRILDLSLVWVKVCQDDQGQILSHAGDVSAFLFENDMTWMGLHNDDSPVIRAVHSHKVVRVTADSDVSLEWQQRLQYDELSDSLFLPFYLAGGKTHAVIGLHSQENNAFDNAFQEIMVDFSEGVRLICQMAEDQSLMRLHRAAVEKTANAIMITNNLGDIEWVNDAFCRQTFFQSDEVIGQKPSLLNSNTVDSNRQLAEMWKVIKSGDTWTGEITNRRKDGSFISVYQTITPLSDEIGEIMHYISVSEDITEQKEHQKRITFMATHDELTELPNRNLLTDRLEHAIAQAKRQQSKMAVLFIDIDHFKYINDSLGHQIGDELLRILAIRLTSILREEDTVARFGGDEFVIVLANANDISKIKELADSLLEQIKQPFHIKSHELLVTGSVGISLYPDDAVDAERLIQNSDSAMYMAKEKGRNNSQFYTTEINEKVTRRLLLENQLRKALKLKQFVLRYQPKVELLTQKITGMEVLIRWQHPELGLVSPIEFISLAEETGLIVEMGDWVMSTACKQMKEWEKEFPYLENISINVSSRQFKRTDFMEKVTQVLSETGVSANKVEFELTESVVMDDVDLVITKMEELKRLGIGLSIDDFGTGYSSLSYLQQFPVDILKIDRSFVNDLTEDDSSTAIVRSILALADNFNLRVVAEGIEEPYQLKILSELGCCYGQGYYFSKAITASKMRVKLQENS